MRTTIDKAGRVVIPKPIREALGLAGGAEVDIVLDGVSIRIDGGTPGRGFRLVDGLAVLDAVLEAEPLTVEGERKHRLDLQR